MAKTSGLIANSNFSTRDFRDAKRAWSERLLLMKDSAEPIAMGASRRSGAHATATSARAVPAPARRNDNVVGVGIAEKLVKGKPTGVLAVKFFVKTKFPTGAVSRGMVLPKSIDGLPVDVEESGTFRAFAKNRKRATATDDTMPNPRTRMRPAQAGSSVGFRIPGDQFVMCGTFGAIVKTSRRIFILSNNHVLADETACRWAPIAEPLNKNLLDAAVLHIGAPSGTAQAAIDMMVHKFGRTTSYTSGRITSIDTDVVVEYETGEFTFGNQIIIRGSNSTMFSDSGDSGSIILQRGTNAAVGLLFGGSSSYTIANHIADVLRSLRVKMA